MNSNNKGMNKGMNKGNNKEAKLNVVDGNAGGNTIGNNNNISFLLNNRLMGNNEGNTKAKGNGTGNGNGNRNGNGGKGNRGGNYGEMQKRIAMNESVAMLMGARATLGSIESSWDQTPFGVKMGYLFILGTIMYYFTAVQYNMWGVIITGTLIAMVVFMWSVFLSILVAGIIAIYLYYKQTERTKLGGYLIEGTKIEDRRVYHGKEDHLYVSPSQLPTELEIGTFTYSFWVYLNKPVRGKIYRDDKWKSIFYRGSKLDSKNDLSSLTQYLGVWLKPDNQTLAFVFQQNGSQNESIEFSDIEYGQWMYFVVNCTKNSVNIFKNSKLEVSSALNQNPISMNDYGIYVTSDYGMAQMDLVSGDISTATEDDDESNDTGFDGYIAYLTYYVENLGVDEMGTVMSFYKDKVDSYEAWKLKMTESDLEFDSFISDDRS